MASKRSMQDVKAAKDEGCSKRLRATSKSQENNSFGATANSFLSSLNIYIMPAGIQKARLSILKSQVLKFGGNVNETFETTQHLSHIIVDDNMDMQRMKRILNIDGIPKIHIVKSAWLSLCLRSKRLEDCNEYLLYEEEEKQCPPSSSENSTKKISDTADQFENTSESSDFESGDEVQRQDEKNFTFGVSSLKTPNLKAEKWICSQSSKNPKPNMNQLITDKLEEMIKAYESTNDRWRAFGYQKAVQTLRRHPKQISSWEEARSLPGIGGRLADKIWEIAQSGELRKLKEFESSEELQVLKRFTEVWGAGPHTAQLWYQLGFRTIADLQKKANLNHQQKVGVRLYDDLLDRMPREEAAEIEGVVKDAAESIQPGIIAQTCGSYRRGKSTCGDVDILITHPDGKSHKNMFHKLLAKLKESGFLTDDLVSAEETGNQKKYMGVCKLPGENRMHRRLDIIVVPYNEYGCALVYFTGSAHFNRSLRHLCKKQNMSLNEHALKQGVVRKGTEKIHEGTVFPTPTEESVFKVLNVPFRPPEERDH